MDIEALYAESAYVVPSDDDPDFSILNGHVPPPLNGYRNGHAHPHQANGFEIGQSRAAGAGALDSWEAWRDNTALRPRSLGAAAPLWEGSAEVAGAAVAQRAGWLTQMFGWAAPSWPLRVVWGLIAIGVVLSWRGMI